MFLKNKLIKKSLCMLAAMTVISGSMLTLSSIVSNNDFCITANAVVVKTNMSPDNFKTAGQINAKNNKVKVFNIYAKNKGKSDIVKFYRDNHVIKKASITKSSTDGVVKMTYGSKTKDGDYCSVLFTANKPGSATVKVQYKDGTVHTATIYVYEYKEVDVTLNTNKLYGTFNTYTIKSKDNALVIKNGNTPYICNKETFCKGNVKLNFVRDKEVQIIPTVGSSGKGTVYVEYETSIQVVNYKCVPTYERTIHSTDIAYEGSKTNTPINASVVSGSSVVINKTCTKKNNENCTIIKAKSSGISKVKITWKTPNGVTFDAYYNFNVKEVNRHSTNNSGSDGTSGTTTNTKNNFVHNSYNSKGQELANGIGLTEHCYKAFNEKWKYVWEGKSYGYVDCGGLIYTYCSNLWSYDMLGLTQSAYSKSNKTWGYISNGIPRVHGLGLHQSAHVGVYVGNNLSIEASNPTYNMVYSSVYNRGWKEWFKIRGAQYPVKGFVKVNGNTFYYENEQYVINCTKTINGVKYTFDSNGFCNKTVPNNEFNKTTWKVY